MSGMQEIERKFIISSLEFKEEAFEHYQIKQGFLNTDPERTVRVRVLADRGFLTVKGSGGEEGISRFEWEKEISLEEANALYELCGPGRIEKTRYLIHSGGHIVEADEFFGDNEGLLIAEIELGSEQEQYEKPSWLGAEVTGQTKYYNSQLSQFPYKDWEK